MAPTVLSPTQWGAAINYDKWTDKFTPDDGVALHHGGSADYPAGRTPYNAANEIAQLRAWEEYHLGKGWRGLAYGWGVGQTGTIYRARGFNTYGAHTGDVDGDGISNNAEIVPIIWIASGNHHTMSPAAAESIAYLRRDVIQVTSPKAVWLYGHKEVQGTPTACPGPAGMDYVLANRLLEDEMAQLTDKEVAAVRQLVAMLDSQVEHPPPWGGGSWAKYLLRWGASKPGPINPVTHIQLAHVVAQLELKDTQLDQAVSAIGDVSGMSETEVRALIEGSTITPPTG